MSRENFSDDQPFTGSSDDNNPQQDPRLQNFEQQQQDYQEQIHQFRREEVLPHTQQPSVHRQLGPILLPQQQQQQQHHQQQHHQQQHQQQQHLQQQHHQQQRHQQQPPAPPPPQLPVLDHLHPQGYFSQPYQQQCGSGKLDKFDSLLPKAGEDRNTLYGHVSRTLGRTLTSPSDAPSTSSSTKSIDLESSSDAYSGGGSSRGGDKPNKICEVCGDKAKSFHFGGVSCDSCKAFFRRAVHSDNYNSFRCAYNDSCVITISNRKTCQSCRFKKCTSIGMEKKWIMTEDERSQLQKQRLEKKQKKGGIAITTAKPSEGRPQSAGSLARGIATYEPDVHAMLNYMTVEEQSEIETLVVKFHQSYKDIPYKVQHCTTSRNSIEIIEMFTTILRRMVYFHKTLPDFNELSQEDQSTLLRQGVLEMCMLRSALTYDFKNNRWPVQTGGMEFLRSCPVLRVEDMKKLVSPDLYKMQMEFISGIQELQADEPIVTLLSLIVLYYPDRTGLNRPDTVTLKQDKYLRYLENYISWRFGPHGCKMYAKFLTKLADLRQLNDSHNEYNLRLAQQEVNQIQEQLSSINLNPYTQWDLVKYDKEKTVGQPMADAGTVQRAQQGLGQSFSHPMEPSQSGQQGPSIPPNIQKMSQHSQNSQSKPPPQDQQHDLPQLIHSQQQQPPPDPNQQSDGQSPQKTNNSAFKPSFVGVLFSQMVNRHIPLLIEDPMADISTEQELATVSRFFADSSMSKMAKMSCSYSATTHTQQAPAQLITATSPIAYDPDSFRSSEPVAPYTATLPPAPFDVNYQQQQQTYYQTQTNRPANENYYSSLKTILDTLGNTNDPTLLHKIKESLSPTVLSKLRETFAAGNTTDLSGVIEPCATTPPRTPTIDQSPTWPTDRRSEEADKTSPQHQQLNNHLSQHQFNSHSSQQLEQHNSHLTLQQAQAQHAPHNQASFTHYQQEAPPQEQRQLNEHTLISEQIQNVLQSFGYERRMQDGYNGFDENDDQFNPDSVRPPCQPTVGERSGHQQSCENLVESPPLPYPQDIHSIQYDNQNGHEQSDPRYQLPENKEMSQKYPW